MKALLRWLIAPLLRWLSQGGEFQIIRCRDDDEGVFVIVLIDAFGNAYSWMKTPEQYRDEAWSMIGEADELENLQTTGGGHES